MSNIDDVDNEHKSSWHDSPLCYPDWVVRLVFQVLNENSMHAMASSELSVRLIGKHDYRER